jgi:hypothetical protein
MLERLILEADRKIVGKLVPGTAEWDTYFAITA